MTGPLFTPAELRALADAPVTSRPFYVDECRRAIRWAADVIQAADSVILENARAKEKLSVARSVIDVQKAVIDVLGEHDKSALLLSPKN